MVAAYALQFAETPLTAIGTPFSPCRRHFPKPRVQYPIGHFGEKLESVDVFLALLPSPLCHLSIAQRLCHRIRLGAIRALSHALIGFRGLRACLKSGLMTHPLLEV